MSSQALNTIMDHEKPQVMVAPPVYTSGPTVVQPDIDLDDLHDRYDDTVGHTAAAKGLRERRGDSLW